MKSWKIGDIAKRLGCTTHGDADLLVVERGSRVVRIRFPDEPQAQFRALLGVRLGIDRLNSAYDFADEEPSLDAPVRNVYEQPSSYGRRTQMLLPVAALRIATEVSGERFVSMQGPWDGAAVVLLLQTGKELHLLSDRDAKRHELDASRTWARSRLALFYDAYKPRPETGVLGEGRVRTYSTADITGASRLLLLPDFDYDAAQSGGFAATPTQQTLVTYECEGLPNLAAFQDFVDARFRSGLMPLSTQCFQLARDSLKPTTPSPADLQDGLEVLDVA